MRTLAAVASGAKNKAALNYKSPDGSKVTMEMRKFFCECAPEVEELQEKLAKANVTLWPSNLEEKVWDDLPQPEKSKLGNKMAVPLEYLKTL